MQHAHLPLERQPKVVIRLSIGGVWVAGSQASHRRPQVSLSLVPLAAPQVPLQVGGSNAGGQISFNLFIRDGRNQLGQTWLLQRCDRWPLHVHAKGVAQEYAAANIPGVTQRFHR